MTFATSRGFADRFDMEMHKLGTFKKFSFKIAGNFKLNEKPY